VTATFTPAHRGGAGEPLVLLHGSLDTWRTWELVLPALEKRHDVLAPALAGHAGGPSFGGAVDAGTMLDAVERAMDDAGFATAHLVGNSLGGYAALRLAERGRARSVVALAPGGGAEAGDPGPQEVLDIQAELLDTVKELAPRAHALVSTPQGRRIATRYTVVNYEHIPADIVAHQMLALASMPDGHAMLDYARGFDWPLDPQRIDCPVRIVWGTADALLPWPSAAARYRRVLPNADWVELEGVGHCPQLDVPLETSQLILGFTD
jgi:pimeloyl-ACP methyl ester carboxylesterase